MRNAKNKTWSLNLHLPQVLEKNYWYVNRIQSHVAGWLLSLFLAVSIQVEDIIEKENLESQNLNFGASVI